MSALLDESMFFTSKNALFRSDLRDKWVEPIGKALMYSLCLNSTSASFSFLFVIPSNYSHANVV